MSEISSDKLSKIDVIWSLLKYSPFVISSIVVGCLIGSPNIVIMGFLSVFLSLWSIGFVIMKRGDN